MDLFILKVIQSIHSPFLDAFFITATRMGEDLFYLPLIAWIYWCVHRENGIRIGLAFFFSAVINGLLKGFIARPRPIGYPEVRTIYAQTAGGSSFPSGHTQGVSVFWRSAAIHLRHPMVGITGVAVVFLVGLSRIYLGVHWPSDVLGGLVIGVLVAEAFGWLEQRLSARLKIYFLLAGGVLLHAACLWHSNHQYLAAGGMFLGAVVGIPLERRWVRFDVNTSLNQQIIKFLTGLGVLLLLRFGVKLVFPGELLIGIYLRYFLIGLWVTVGAPWLFVRLGLTPNQPKIQSLSSRWWVNTP